MSGENKPGKDVKSKKTEKSDKKKIKHDPQAESARTIFGKEK
ncbi:MAG: CPC_1213 family protein [Clostridia bacterium]|nr:CPC_1213 family protein [Clostridia bacterium]